MEVHGPPIIPPPRGDPATPTKRARRGGVRERQEGGQGREPQAATQRGSREAAVKPVRTPVAILGSLGVCIYVPASRHWLISYSPIHLT